MPPADGLVSRIEAQQWAVDAPIVILSGTRKNPEFPGKTLEQDRKLQLQLHQARLATLPRGRRAPVPQSRQCIQNGAPVTGSMLSRKC
jgi:hypothetical protein